MYETHECEGDDEMKLYQPRGKLMRLLDELRVARDLGNYGRAEEIIQEIFLLVGLQP